MWDSDIQPLSHGSVVHTKIAGVKMQESIYKMSLHLVNTLFYFIFNTLLCNIKKNPNPQDFLCF